MQEEKGDLHHLHLDCSFTCKVQNLSFATQTKTTVEGPF